MNAINQNEQPAILQPTEATPLEDRSLPAGETIREQQAETAEQSSAPIFVP